MNVKRLPQYVNTGTSTRWIISVFYLSTPEPSRWQRLRWFLRRLRP